MERRLYRYFFIWVVLTEIIILCKYIFDMPHSLLICSSLMCGILFILIYPYKHKLKHLNFKKIKRYLYNCSIQIIVSFIMGILIITAGINLGEMAYILLGLIIAVLIPSFWLLVKKEYRKLFLDAVSLGTVIVFILITILSIVFVPLSNTQYSSIIGNPNEFGNILVFSLCCILYRYNITKKNIYVFFATINISFAILSISRTTYLCIIAIITINLIYYFIIYEYKKLIINVLKVILVFLFSFLMLFALLTSGNSLIRSLEKQILGSEYVYYAKLYKYDGSKMGFNDLFEYIELRTLKGISTDNKKNEDVDIEDVDINEMSSGRVEIWKDFFDNIKLYGHNIGEKVYIKSTNQYGLDAHNTYLNNGYYYGCISGATVIIYMIILLYFNFIKLIILIKTKKEDPEFYFMSMIFVSFSILSILSSVFSPFHSMIAFGFWFICFYYRKDYSLNLNGGMRINSCMDKISEG